MEAALITGGGDYIAFTIGRLKALDKKYDIVIGTSAGALITPFVALNDISKAEIAISNISPDRIFSINPFNKKGHIKIFNAIKRIIFGKRTLGENDNLPKFIKEYYTEEDHSKLKKSDVLAYITICNTNKADYPGEIVCLNTSTYEEAVKYMWASASVPLVCSLVKIGNYEYADGGTTLNVPADFLVEQGIKKMDVFLHDTEPQNEIRSFVKSVFNMIGRIVKWQRQKVQYDQILSVSTINNSVKTKLYWLPYHPANMQLMFDKTIMKKYIEDGYKQIK